MDLVEHLIRQRAFSQRTFGPGHRTWAIMEHMLKEMKEVRLVRGQDEDPLPEWVDLILLALDGAWRTGASPEAVAAAIAAKQRINEQREWPDWRTAPDGHAIEHVRPTS